MVPVGKLERPDYHPVTRQTQESAVLHKQISPDFLFKDPAKYHSFVDRASSFKQSSDRSPRQDRPSTPRQAAKTQHGKFSADRQLGKEGSNLMEQAYS